MGKTFEWNFVRLSALKSLLWENKFKKNIFPSGIQKMSMENGALFLGIINYIESSSGKNPGIALYGPKLWIGVAKQLKLVTIWNLTLAVIWVQISTGP